EDVKNAVGVDLELHAHPGHTAWRRLELEREPAEAPIVLRSLALALEGMDKHFALEIDRSGESFTGFHWNRGVAGDDDVHQSAERLEAERERRDIQEQHVLEAAAENLRLDGRAQCDRLV